MSVASDFGHLTHSRTCCPVYRQTDRLTAVRAHTNSHHRTRKETVLIQSVWLSVIMAWCSAVPNYSLCRNEVHVRLARRTLTSVVRTLYVHQIHLDSELLLMVSSCDESSRPVKCLKYLNDTTASPIARTPSHIPQVATVLPSVLGLKLSLYRPWQLKWPPEGWGFQNF